MGDLRSIRAAYDAGRSTPYHERPPPKMAPDADVSSAGQRIWDWVRDLADNSAVIAAILSARTTNAIGPGLTYEPLVRDRRGELLTDANDLLRAAHVGWSKSVDVTGELTRSELERLVFRSADLDGEIFLRTVRRRFGGGHYQRRGPMDPLVHRQQQNLPYRIQAVEADLVPIWLTEQRGDEWVVNGVGKDEWGAPQRYYILPSQNDYSRVYGYPGMSQNLENVPARDMYHYKRPGRPGQTRGVSLLAQVIFRVADMAEFEQSHRLAARASSNLFLSINRALDMDPSSVFGPSTPGGADPQKPARVGFDFEPLMVLDGMAPGETANFHAPQHPNQNAVDFIKQNTRAVCAACDVSASQVMQVFENSYSAQRMELINVWRTVERDRGKFIADFARSALYEEPMWAAIQGKLIPKSLLRRADPSSLVDAAIDGPQMPVIDPVKDRLAYRIDKEEGWESNGGIMRRMGRIPTDVQAEIERENAQKGAGGENEQDEEGKGEKK